MCIPAYTRAVNRWQIKANIRLLSCKNSFSASPLILQVSGLSWTDEHDRYSLTGCSGDGCGEHSLTYQSKIFQRCSVGLRWRRKTQTSESHHFHPHQIVQCSSAFTVSPLVIQVLPFEIYHIHLYWWPSAPSDRAALKTNKYKGCGLGSGDCCTINTERYIQVFQVTYAAVMNLYQVCPCLF